MEEKLNYRALIKSWMRFYGLTAERSKKLFASIWMRVQGTKTETETLENGGKIDGTHME